MTDQLTIPGAERTPSVALTTLTIQGRRITRALYGQLREEPLIAGDGGLNGTPWSYVNEHVKNGDCGRFRGRDAEGQYKHDNIDRSHRHVVWQRDDELMRDVVLSLDAAQRRFAWAGDELRLEWSQWPPETIPARRRSHLLVAGLPQIFIGR